MGNIKKTITLNPLKGQKQESKLKLQTVFFLKRETRMPFSQRMCMVYMTLSALETSLPMYRRSLHLVLGSKA